MKLETLNNNQFDLNKQREENLKKWQESAKLQNKGRSLIDKVTGRNKVSLTDEMRHEADLDNKIFDRKDFRDGTMEDFSMPDEGRDLEVYESQLMFDRNELKGKTVLDLGAGPKLKLARTLKECGITDDVTSLSPDFRYSQYARQAQAVMPDAKIVSDVGQKMSFDDKTFDIVLALHVCEHLNHKHFLETILEVGRVLRAGGKAIIGPTSDESFDPDEQIWRPYEAILQDKNIKDRFKEWGIGVEKVMIPGNIVERRRLINKHGIKYFESGYNIVLKREN